MIGTFFVSERKLTKLNCDIGIISGRDTYLTVPVRSRHCWRTSTAHSGRVGSPYVASIVARYDESSYNVVHPWQYFPWPVPRDMHSGVQASQDRRKLLGSMTARRVRATSSRDVNEKYVV